MCEENMLWPMTLLDLVVCCFFLFILCNRVLLVSDNFKGPMEMVGSDHYFQCSAE
jgi:hypothetical protein